MLVLRLSMPSSEATPAAEVRTAEEARALLDETMSII